MGKKKYILNEELRYYSKRYDITIDIPKLFKWDGSSGLFILDIPPYLASCVHDYLYQHHAYYNLSRWQCDMIYHDMLVDNNRWIRAKIRFIGLVLFGWLFFK